MKSSKKTSGSVGNTTSNQLTSLREGFPASLFPMLEEEKEQKMTVISVRKCLELSRNLSQGGLLAKTLLSSSVWMMAKHLKTYSLIWQTKAIGRKRILFQLAVSEPDTEETGCGLLPTVQHSEAFKAAKNSNQNSLTRMALRGELVPIPTNSMITYQDFIQAKYHSKKRPKYSMIPTPSARDWKSSNASEKTMNKNSRPLNEFVTWGSSGKLNPEWVEWLMGYPKSWTELKESQASETR